MPAASMTARTGPPAIMPVPGAAGLSRTAPAPYLPTISWGMVVPFRADKMLKIELKKSLIGRGAKQIATAEALGLKKPGDVTVQPDNAATQGKIAKIGFMLSVTEA